MVKWGYLTFLIFGDARFLVLNWDLFGFWGLIGMKSAQKGAKKRKNLQKCAFFGRKVCEKCVFLRFCAPDFQSDSSIWYVVSRISKVAKWRKVVKN